MRRLVLLLVAMMVLSLAAASASAGPPAWANPTPGICPNPGAPDDDGDGIPNGQDPDYTRPQDGTGNQWRRGGSIGPVWLMPYFAGAFGVVSLNSIAIPVQVGGYGPGDCTGNGGIGPRDGTGYGPGPGAHRGW